MEAVIVGKLLLCTYFMEFPDKSQSSSFIILKSFMHIWCGKVW